MYQHTQFAWAIWAILAWIASFLVMAIVLIGNIGAILLFAGFLALIGILFYGLTIKVDQQAQRLTWWFGPGVARKSLHFDEIVSVKAVTNSFRHGIGMRISNDGWVYTVSGFQAIEVTLEDDTKYRLGTNDQAGLLKALSNKVVSGPEQNEKGVQGYVEQNNKQKKDAFDMD